MNRGTTLLITAFTLLISAFTNNSHAADPRQNIIPLPVETVLSDGTFILSPGTTITALPGSDFDMLHYLRDLLLGQAQYSIEYTRKWEVENVIRLMPFSQADMPAEAYILTVSEDTVTIEAGDRGGFLYGIQTLLQLLPAQALSRLPLDEEFAIPCVTVKDYPAMEYRGFMFDVARTFCSKQTVLSLIDRLAFHKINKMHWHLTDDEGWRIELNCYPELAQQAGFRGGDSPVRPIYGNWDTKYGGYFTQKEIREIVAYASMRNIEVIPEIDLPGHSRAAAKIFPGILCMGKVDTSASGDDRRNVWCASKESNYDMLRDLLEEISTLFPSQYIHIGGDEVAMSQWKNCPDCQKLMADKNLESTKELADHFTDRLTRILAAKGKTACVWDEAAATGFMSKNNIVYGWQHVDACLEATKKGYRTVVMPGSFFYIDMRPSPFEDGATWAGEVDPKRVYSFSFGKTDFTQAHMANVMGVQAAFFSELWVSHDEEYLDYHLFPSLCALSEVAWTAEGRRSWENFYGRLTASHLARLSALDIAYRQFPPVVDYKDGAITARAPFEGAKIHYTTDGSAPTQSSPLYSGPIEDSAPEQYLFSAFYMNNGSYGVAPSSKTAMAVGAKSSKTMEVAVKDIIDSDGLWYMKIRTSDPNMKIKNMFYTSADGTAYVIRNPQRLNQFHQIRIYSDKKRRNSTLKVTMENDNSYPCDVTFEFYRSPYIEPAVTFTSSLAQNTRFPFKNVQDYNFTTYSRTSTTCSKGDHFTFTFANPVDAESIEIATGLFYMPRYHIPFGRVQVSANGTDYTDIAELSLGKATIYPQSKVKAVRIVSDSDHNSENAVAIQDLKIKPRK